MKKTLIFACAMMMLTGCQNPAPAQEQQTSAQTTAVQTIASTTAVSASATATSSKTSTSEAETTSAEHVEDVFVDHDGIRITSKGLGFSEKFAAIIIEIDNQSAQDIVVQTRDFSVNDYMCKAALSQEVIAGKKAKANIRIFDDELAKNGLKKEDIRDVEFKINISTPDFMTEIYQSDAIKRHYEPS